MANRRGGDGGFKQPERENPFDAFEQQDETMGENMDVSPDGGREDVFEDDPYEDPIDGDEESGGLRGFLSTVQGKALCIAVVVLTLILIGVIVWRFVFFKPKQDSAQLPGDVSANLPEEGSAPSVVFGPTDTDAPDDGPTSIVFMPSDGDEEEGTGEPYGGEEPGDPDADAPEGTPVIFSPIAADEPEETAAPEETLPIVMSNTPTPSPTVAPTPSPTPSPEPTPTPTPSPTPIADIGTGKTNRDANLRAEMSAQSSVKKLVKRGETVTIHEAVMDAEGKLWYALTVDDISTDGWMRDYVVALDGPLAQPISFAPAEAGAGATAAPSLPDGVIGTGKTNRDANVRKIMNGKVVTQLRKNHKVDILAVKQDKAGDTWYQIRTENGTTGYVRNYLITLSSGTVLPGAQTPTPKPGSGTANPTAKISLPTPGPAGTPTPRPTLIPTVPPAGAVTPAASSSLSGTSSGLSGTSSGLSGTSSGLSGTSSGLSGTSSSLSGTSSSLNGASSGLSSAAPAAVATANPAYAASANAGMQAAAQTVDPASRPSIGVAYTNREANIREKPLASAKLVRQLAHGTELRILGKYESEGKIWYEVVTTSGKTYGFARDYVLTIK